MLVSDGFSCNIPEPQIKYMKEVKNNQNCKPMIECDVSNPYSNPSVLAHSQCYKVNKNQESNEANWWKKKQKCFADWRRHWSDLLVVLGASFDCWHFPGINHLFAEHSDNNCNTWDIDWPLRNRSTIGLGSTCLGHFPVNFGSMWHSWRYLCPSYRVHRTLGHRRSCYAL